MQENEDFTEFLIRNSLFNPEFHFRNSRIKSYPFTAIINAQKAFEGAAMDFGVNSEEDVQRLVDKVRYGKK